MPAKAQRAQRDLEEAGLGDYADMRVSDAAQTLRSLPQEVDFMLNDGFPPGAVPVLRLVQPWLRCGAIVLADNVGAFPADHQEYLVYVRDPLNGFGSCALDLSEGSEMSMRV